MSLRLRAGSLPRSCQQELTRAMQIEDPVERLNAIDRARERAARNFPELFREEKTMKVKLQNVRLAFPNIFEAKAFEAGGKADFNASFILPKNHPQVAEIKRAMQAVAQQKWGEKAKGIYDGLDKQDKLALHDGDTKSNYEGFEDNLFISARNKVKPLVIDKDKSPLSAQDGKPYAGCYVNVSLEFWAMDNQYGKRVNASLGGVQFVKDGDAFAGGGVADVDDFDDLGAGGEAGGKVEAGEDLW